MDSGKIPQHFIDDLLARIDIVDIIASRVKLKRAGHNHMGLCPFHNEKSPSFSVNQNKQFYHCFGCGVGGDAIKFLTDYEHMEFVQAIEELARIAGVEVPRDEKPQDIEKNKQQRIIYDLLKTASEQYYEQLKSHPNRDIAVKYLKGRGLSGQIARQFQIGYSPEGWSNLKDALEAKKISTDLLLVSGLVVENDKGKVYDRFRNRIMFPIRDARGRYIGFGGRVLSAEEKPKYLNSPETPVFQKGKELYGLYEAKLANRQLTRALIVEGYMDVVVLAQHGISYAMATLGTATSSVHLERLFKLLSDVVFCFDGDNAGRKAAQRAMELSIGMLEDGRQIRFLFLPEGEDPDSLVRQEGKTAFEDRIHNATPLLELIFQQEKEGIQFDSLDGKARYARAVLAWIRQLPPKSLMRPLAIKRLADNTGLAEAQLTTLEAEQAVANPRYAEKAVENSPVETAEAPAATEAHNEYYPENRIDFNAPTPQKKRSTLSSAQKIIANIIRLPKLLSELQLDPDLHNSHDNDIQLLIEIQRLLTVRQKPDAAPHLTCIWLHEQGLKAGLRPIEKSDYFWLPKPGSGEAPLAWISAEFEKNNADLVNYLPDQEYLHLKNRITNHTSEVTDAERKRFSELVMSRKQRKAR